MSEVDWSQIKIEYITSAVSTRELAERHGVGKDAVEQRCYKEKWVEERQKRAEQFESELIARIQTEKNSEIAELNTAVISIGKMTFNSLLTRWQNHNSGDSVMTLAEQAQATKVLVGTHVQLRLATGQSTHNADTVLKDERDTVLTPSEQAAIEAILQNEC